MYNLHRSRNDCHGVKNSFDKLDARQEECILIAVHRKILKEIPRDGIKFTSFTVSASSIIVNSPAK